MHGAKGVQHAKPYRNQRRQLQRLDRNSIYNRLLFRAETPVYEGGMSTTIDFEAVVSNSASVASGIEEPLGSLAGRGFNRGKNGGKIVIKCNEPCYIIVTGKQIGRAHV